MNGRPGRRHRFGLVAVAASVTIGGCAAERVTDTAVANPVERSASGLYERFVGGEGMTEVSDTAFEVMPTEEQTREAEELRASAKRSVEAGGFTDFASLKAAGFSPISEGNSHWVNEKNILDGYTLNVEKPEFLVVQPPMIDPTDTGQKVDVQGVMFLAGRIGAHGLQPFGNAFIWHRHTYSGPRCFQYGQIMRVDWDAQKCDDPANESMLSRETPEMLHMWLTDNPNGPFASQMVVPDIGDEHSH